MKKYLLSLFAVVLAVGLSSYSPKTDLEWFNYDGDIYGLGPANAMNYTLIGSPICPFTNPNVCEIHAERLPDLSPARPNLTTEVTIDRTFRH